ncbi:TetR/AcrR family transcriptional regulator [Paenibacillus dendritiformis]|uniref:TetR/AcrR family transcriptional regulator n=1 Tax=Paenibacillus dendritiformis TaxID=130049 RepID=UPI00105945F3|nr:TetR family transcriptional regulator [Paenibacillus dendritiformis]TDL57727.1 TetR/AcrR family transcriptional regulator [Paenibacillus dendritiformis]
MAPKKKFTREQIIDAAFEIARMEGLASITIRKVADRLGSSIAPIYVNFQDAEELIQEVIKKTVQVSQQMLEEMSTGNPFYDIGAASLRFAREYSELFRELVMKPNPYMNGYEQDMGPILIGQMKQDADLQGFSDEELMMILMKMKIFQLGLSVMVANGLLPEPWDEGRAMELLSGAANDVIAAARMRKRAERD